MLSRLSGKIDKLKGWKKDVTTALMISGALSVFATAGWAVNVAYEYWQRKHTLQSRIRIVAVQVIPEPTAEAPFPGINIYYDNVGTLPASSIVSKYAAGFGNGLLPAERIQAEQDNLLKWPGWRSDMKAKTQAEMHAGDPPEFTSIPNMEGTLADDFRANIKNVRTGQTFLYVFITFKYKDASMSADAFGVTEDCFWFSGNFARHKCGRSRSFLETK